MTFLRLFLIFFLIVLYSFGIRLEFLIGAGASFAAFLPQFWELLIFGVLFDALTSVHFGAITIIFFLLIFLEELLKMFIESSGLASRLAIAFFGAVFFDFLFFGWRFVMGASFDIMKFLVFILLAALGVIFFILALAAVNFLIINVFSKEKI